MRLDKALAQAPEIESRSQATRLIDLGCVELDGKKVKPSLQTEIGQKFLVTLPAAEKRELVPLELKLDIRYEDEHLLVVNKPAGLVVHPAAGHFEDTLVNALLHHCNQLSSGFAADRPGIVHRLDKDTSGLLVVAKDDATHRSLAKQFKNKRVHRVYWALCYGHFKSAQGTVTSYLRRHPTDRKRFSSDKSSEPTGKLAITHYEVVGSIPAGISRVHLRLETGRTHQIRVHMTELGHALVADPIYGSPQRTKSLNSMRAREVVGRIPRLALHAAELGFVHPKTGRTIQFFATWPEDLRPYVKELGLDLPQDAGAQ